MRKSRVILFVLGIALLAVFAFVAAVGLSGSDNIPFHIQITCNNDTENIKCWKNTSGEYYVFLPSYAEMNDVKIKPDTATSVKINGKKIYDGMNCEVFDNDKELEIEYSYFGKKVTKSITFLKSGNLPTMYINTESGSMDYINDKKGNKESGSYKIYTAQGDVNTFGSIEAIGGRGNSTWNYFDKKPYNITLSTSEDLLGMGNAQKWVLLSNAIDSSNLRNKLVYDFAKEIGLMSPESEWIDLYLNGEYAGLYLLCRRNDTYFAADNAFKNETFLVSLEFKDRLVQQSMPHIVTNANQALRIHSTTMSEEKITEILQSAENAILAENGKDAITNKHWRELIDTDSWVRKYLVEEVFGNLDACYLSQYFYYGKDMNSTKIFAGPVWDYDMTMGNKDNWSLGSSDILVANRLQVGGGDITPWFNSLYSNKEFYSQVLKIYETEFLPRISDILNKRITEYSNLIFKADKSDRIRWAQYRAKGLEYEVEYICEYMQNRLEFLNNIWLNNREYVILKMNPGSGYYIGYWNIHHGKILSELPVLKDTVYGRFDGWYYADTNEPFDINKPIFEDTEIYAKWQSSSHKRTEQTIKLIPIAVISVLFIVLLAVELRRVRRKR